RQAKALLPASMPSNAALPPPEVATSRRPSSSDWEWLETSNAIAVAGEGSAVASKTAYPERESPSGSIVHTVGFPSSAMPAAYTMLATGCQANEVAWPGRGMGGRVVWLSSGAEETTNPPLLGPCSSVPGSGP